MPRCSLSGLTKLTKSLGMNLNEFDIVFEAKSLLSELGVKLAPLNKFIFLRKFVLRFLWFKIQNELRKQRCHFTPWLRLLQHNHFSTWAWWFLSFYWHITNQISNIFVRTQWRLIFCLFDGIFWRTPNFLKLCFVSTARSTCALHKNYKLGRIWKFRRFSDDFNIFFMHSSG